MLPQRFGWIRARKVHSTGNGRTVLTGPDQSQSQYLAALFGALSPALCRRHGRPNSGKSSHAVARPQITSDVGDG